MFFTCEHLYLVLCKVDEAEKKRRFILKVKFEDMKCFMLMLGIKSKT